MGSTFTIKILLDNLRGSRGEMNSRKMLLPLLNENPSSQVTFLQTCSCKGIFIYIFDEQVAMYNTPKLSGILSQILPQRCNELIGLQHMKIYVVDDDVLISGYVIKLLFF